MSTDVDYIFGVLLKKEVARKSDEIAERVEQIVDKHFEELDSEQMLDRTQINRFTGIAYSSDNTKSLQEFIEKQAGKEHKAKKKWTTNGLDKSLLKEIKEIVGEHSEKVYDMTLEDVKKSVEKVETNEFDKANRKKFIHEISIELQKRFATHFGIHYLYRKEG